MYFINMETLKDIIINKKHIKYRKKINELNEQFSKQNLSDIERITRRFEIICENETPIILDSQQIIFMRTIENTPDIYTNDEWNEIRKKHYVHETGYVSNLCCDYEGIISKGLLEYFKDSNDYVQREINALLDLCDRYLEKAKELKRQDIIDMFTWIPRNSARTFKEALQFFRILHYAYLIEGGYQIVGGRIDQMFYPYLKNDLDKGILNENSALELVKDFFLSFNIDSDFYDGVQQGDNGQAIVLGGCDCNGNECFNLLSKLCLQASKENKLIDPKINLRVNKNTPLEIYELASELTAVGLGFPQYLNDDIIISGLVDKGYDLIDARNYVVAACWEIILPKLSFEVVNIDACSFPKVLENTVYKKDYSSYEELYNEFKIELQKECDRLINKHKNIYFVPSPLIESSLDIKYRNYGMHGTGISSAVDSLYALYERVYNRQTITLDEYKQAVDNDYEGYEPLLNKLRYHTYKMGQNIEDVDNIAIDLLNEFSNCLKDKRNEFNGIYRPGTGTAMFYLEHANEIKAGFDGRRKNEPFSANYSPSIYAHINGPFSILESFTKPNLQDCMNGGPLTLEFSSSMFDSQDSIRKTALFVRTFIHLGGHQLQCNAVNIDDLKDAQIHPEKYKNLIVRIWGWSAYFVELDQDFQNHVIMRKEYSL